jgi:hypothetical protein
MVLQKRCRCQQWRCQFLRAPRKLKQVCNPLTLLPQVTHPVFEDCQTVVIARQTQRVHQNGRTCRLNTWQRSDMLRTPFTTIQLCCHACHRLTYIRCCGENRKGCHSLRACCTQNRPPDTTKSASSFQHFLVGCSAVNSRAQQNRM